MVGDQGGPAGREPARRTARNQSGSSPCRAGAVVGRRRWRVNTSLAPAAARTWAAASTPACMRASSARLSRQRTRGLPSQSRTRPPRRCRGHSTPTSDRLASRRIRSRWNGRPPGQGHRGRPRVHGHRLEIGGVRGRATRLAQWRSLESPPTSGPARRTPPWQRCRVQARVLADLAAETGPQQQGQGLDRPGGGHHRPVRPPASVAAGAGLDAGSPAFVDQHPAGVGPDDQPGPGRGRLLQVGDQVDCLAPCSSQTRTNRSRHPPRQPRTLRGSGPACQPSWSGPLSSRSRAPGRLWASTTRSRPPRPPP